MKGNGIGKIFPRNQTIDQRLARGLIECIDHAENAGEDENVPIKNKIKIYRQPVDKRLNHAEKLRKNKQPAPIEAICDGTAESAEE